MGIAFLARNERRWSFVLLLCAIAGHTYSLTVTGAKIWIDSIAYFQLAQAIFDADLLQRLYDSDFGFFYQHSGIGLPLLIRMLDAVFQHLLWPALAVVQYFLSAVAVTYFVLAFRTKLSRSAQLAAVVICSLHPYFMSFHGAALTESISATVLLVSLGLAIRALDGRISLTAALALLLPLSFIAMQFRPYLGLVGIFTAAALVFQLGKPRRILLYAMTVLTLAAGTLAFPVYRAVVGVGFFLPNVNSLLLTHVSYVAWDLDNETALDLKSVILNDSIRERFIGKGPFDYNDGKHVFDDLVSAGVSAADARRRIAAAAWKVRTSSFWFIERQLQLPLASIGLQFAPVCCWPYRQMTRDLDAVGMFKHIRGYWRWNSGLDKNSYIESFDRFSEMTRSSHVFTDAAQEFYSARIRPYVTDSLRKFRDPLRLRFLVTDPFFIVAWIGLFLFFWPAQRTALLVLAAPFAVIYVSSVFAHIFGDNRHAHPLIPIIVVGAVKAVEEFFVRRAWSRIPGFRTLARQIAAR